MLETRLVRHNLLCMLLYFVYVYYIHVPIVMRKVRPVYLRGDIIANHVGFGCEHKRPSTRPILYEKG